MFAKEEQCLQWTQGFLQAGRLGLGCGYLGTKERGDPQGQGLGTPRLQLQWCLVKMGLLPFNLPAKDGKRPEVERTFPNDIRDQPL